MKIWALPGWKKLTIFLIGFIAIGTLFLFVPQRIVDPFTTSVRSSVSIPLYYPSQLPNGYSIDKSSIVQPQTDTVVYIIKKQSQAIHVSEEPLPKTDFDIKTFYGNFTSKKDISTPIGLATLGTLRSGQTLLSIVVNSRTWIILNTKDSHSADDIPVIAQHLTLSQ